jgi:arylsulfatase A-like enzyme
MRFVKPMLLALMASMVALTSTTASAQPPAAASTRPPNIVIMFADDLGYGDLSVYGHPLIKTPRLDRLASEGLKLTSFYASAPVCSASRYSLLTGRYAVRAGINGALMPESKNGLGAGETTIADILKAAGYRTGMVGKWHLGNKPGFFPTEHGFDSYFGLLYSNDMIRPWVQTDAPLRLYRGTQELPGEVDVSTLTERYTEEALAFIRASQGRPFFLYFAHSMPHVPLGASLRFAGKSANGRYGDVIETIDWSAGQVLDALREAGVERNTLVIFTSDNGPWMDMPPRMLVEPRIVRTDAGSAGPLRGSKGTSWEGGTRVPFLARWPGRIPAGSVSADLARTLDILPTIAGIAGAPLPAGRAIDGQDIRAFLEGKAPSPDEWFFYYDAGGRLEGVRDRRWKLHLRFPDKAEPVTELFDLAADPSERWDVAAEHPDIVTRLAGRMRQFAGEIAGNPARYP